MMKGRLKRKNSATSSNCSGPAGLRKDVISPVTERISNGMAASPGRYSKNSGPIEPYPAVDLTSNCPPNAFIMVRGWLVRKGQKARKIKKVMTE